MLKKIIFTILSLEIIYLHGNTELPGRVGSNISWVQFGTTDVFFYMTPKKQALMEKLVSEINQEKLQLSVDINDYDCFTTEISATASKYPDPIASSSEGPIFADLKGHLVLETFAKSLQELLFSELDLQIQGVSREINFILSQDAHKFHQDQSTKQFSFLNQRNPHLPPCKIIQDLTLIDWDMSSDTFSATIVQDSLSNDRFLLALYPKEQVGMLFTQSSTYLTREAHPSYLVPTIFPYHAVLSPIDQKATISSGSSKGKRLSTVVRGVVEEDEIEQLKHTAKELILNRPFLSKEPGQSLLYPNGIVVKDLPLEITPLLNQYNEWVYKYPDKENSEIIKMIPKNSSEITHLIASLLEIQTSSIQHISLFQITKRDSGFSQFHLMDLPLSPNSQIILVNASEVSEDHDYFHLAQDFTDDGLPWIQLYHCPPQKAFLVSRDLFYKLSLTPIEEILYRKAEMDSKKTDGISSSRKLVSKFNIIVIDKDIF